MNKLPFNPLWLLVIPAVIVGVPLLKGLGSTAGAIGDVIGLPGNLVRGLNKQFDD